MWTHSPQSSIMMERILLVLYLSGWHILSSCLPHQYHFVADPMNWTEAQTYCRQTYTDLATIENSEEMQELINTASSSDVWIGVYSNLSWWWSDGYNGSGADYRDWGYVKPESSTNCVMIHTSYPWYPWYCSDPYPFICNKGTQQDPQFVLVNKKMTWSDAQKYCRENHLDLATARNDKENHELKILAAGTWPWIGLFREHVSYWSDGSNYSFSYWTKSFIPGTFVSPLCGAAALKDSGKWKLSLCGTRLPFVCYSVPLAQPRVTRKVVKLRIKAEDIGSVDLNNPAVKAEILRKLQDRLKDKGVSGVTLKWREQPDGKVFHKEEKQKKRRKKTEL